MLTKQVFSTHRQGIIKSQRMGEISKSFFQRKRMEGGGIDEIKPSS